MPGWISMIKSSLSAEKGTKDKLKNAKLTDVLIVDDDSQSLELLIDFFPIFLPELNTNISIANNGKEALEKISSSSIDLLITDYDMPELNGLELIKKIRANAIFHPMKIVLMTGSEYSSEISEALSLADAHMFKPISIEHLSDMISSWYIIDTT